MKFITLFGLFLALVVSIEGNIVGRRPVIKSRIAPRVHHRILSPEHHGLHHTASHVTVHAKSRILPAPAVHMHGHPRHNVKVVRKETVVQAVPIHSHPTRPIHGHSKMIVPSKLKMSTMPHHSKLRSRPRHAHVRNHH